jgi:hypothetical protein
MDERIARLAVWISLNPINVLFLWKPLLGAGFKRKKRNFSLRLSDPDWIQTNDLLLRRQLLYSTELPGRNWDKAF